MILAGKERTLFHCSQFFCIFQSCAEGHRNHDEVRRGFGLAGVGRGNLLIMLALVFLKQTAAHRNTVSRYRVLVPRRPTRPTARARTGWPLDAQNCPTIRRQAQGGEKGHGQFPGCGSNPRAKSVTTLCDHYMAILSATGSWETLTEPV